MSERLPDWRAMTLPCLAKSTGDSSWRQKPACLHAPAIIAGMLVRLHRSVSRKLIVDRDPALAPLDHLGFRVFGVRVQENVLRAKDVQIESSVVCWEVRHAVSSVGLLKTKPL